jgi:hypothetical protein
MTLNDVTLNSHCLRIKGIAVRLSKAMADGRLSELCEALGAIHDVSRNALWRINDMQYGRNANEAYSADKPESHTVQGISAEYPAQGVKP